jgi:hypothetical protein
LTITARTLTALRRHSTTVAVAGLGLIAAIVGATIPASASAMSNGTVTVAYAIDNPCALLTVKQADSAAGVKFGPGQQIPKVLCEYSSNAPSAENATINLTIGLGTVKGSLPPADLGNRYEPVPALGHDAIWVIEKGAPKGTGELYFSLGFVGKTAYTVQVELAQGGLPEATKIASDCLGHVQSSRTRHD